MLGLLFFFYYLWDANDTPCIIERSECLRILIFQNCAMNSKMSILTEVWI